MLSYLKLIVFITGIVHDECLVSSGAYLAASIHLVGGEAVYDLEGLFR
jgi:hypothetical protein